MPHVPDRHADHDRLLVAAYAAGDAGGADREQAAALVAGCPDCAALHHDLRAIAAALPSLPAPVRPRDFRLTPEQAASHRPSRRQGWLARLAGPRFSFATPLGTGLATLGIAGLLLAGSLGVPVASAPRSGGTSESMAAVPASPAASAGAEVPQENAAVPGPSDDSGTGPGLLALPSGPASGSAAEKDAEGSSAGAADASVPGASTSVSHRSAQSSGGSSGTVSSLNLLALLALLTGGGLVGLRLVAARLS